MRESILEDRGKIRENIRRILEQNRFAVLATQLRGQPHASLIAFTPLEGITFLGFATYRNTLKYQSIQEDGRVAILIEDRGKEPGPLDRRMVLTAIGEAIKTSKEALEAHIRRHLARHPDLEGFLSSQDCEFVVVSVNAYQLVKGIGAVEWYTVKDSPNG
ncbi:MAG: pyridoxamine 5'-phosphate oxidase family protein [Desulfatiglandales bacterium]